MDGDQCYTIHKVLVGTKLFRLYPLEVRLRQLLNLKVTDDMIYMCEVCAGQTIIFPPLMFHEVAGPFMTEVLIL